MKEMFIVALILVAANAWAGEKNYIIKFSPYPPHFGAGEVICASGICKDATAKNFQRCAREGGRTWVERPYGDAEDVYVCSAIGTKYDRERNEQMTKKWREKVTVKP